MEITNPSRDSTFINPSTQEKTHQPISGQPNTSLQNKNKYKPRNKLKERGRGLPSEEESIAVEQHHTQPTTLPPRPQLW